MYRVTVRPEEVPALGRGGNIVRTECFSGLKVYRQGEGQELGMRGIFQRFSGNRFALILDPDLLCISIARTSYAGSHTLATRAVAKITLQLRLDLDFKEGTPGSCGYF